MAKLELRLRTFLPFDYAPHPLNSNQRFHGDGKDRLGGEWHSSKYRTSQSFMIDTSKANYITSATSNTGITILEELQNGKWVKIKSKQQSTDTIKYATEVIDDILYINCKCASNNPLVTGSPDIDYQFTLKVTRTGSVRIKGYHDGFPGYEFMRNIYSMNKGPETIYVHKPKSLDEINKLFPPMDIGLVDVGRPYDSWVNN